MAGDAILTRRFRTSDQPPHTTNTTTAARGRYIRRSAPTSVAIGTKLDVGARVTKNHVPRKASSRLGACPRFSDTLLVRHANAVAASRMAMAAAHGHTSSVDTGCGTP